MTGLIPDAIRCSYNFPGHTPHWGRVQHQARQGGRGVGERIISVVKQSPTSLLVATASGTVTTYYNHQPERLVAVWQLYPEAGHLYRDVGLIGVRHQERSADDVHDAEYLFSVTTTGYRTCLEIQDNITRLSEGERGP